MNLLAAGRRRFRIVEVTQWRPYVAGEVSYLDPEQRGGGCHATALSDQAREELVGYLQRGLELAYPHDAAGPPPCSAPFALPRDPAGVSFIVAATLALPAAVKQALLDETGTSARLEQLLAHLEQAREEQEALLRLRDSRPEVLPLNAGDDTRWITRN